MKLTTGITIKGLNMAIRIGPPCTLKFGEGNSNLNKNSTMMSSGKYEKIAPVITNIKKITRLIVINFFIPAN
jgi:hypothetical protein